MPNERRPLARSRTDAVGEAELREATRVVIVLAQRDSHFLDGDREPGVKDGEVVPALIARGWRITATRPAPGGAYFFLAPPMAA